MNPFKRRRAEQPGGQGTDVIPKLKPYKFSGEALLTLCANASNLPNTPENAGLYERLEHAYCGHGSVKLAPDELITMRRLLGKGNGTIGAYGKEARAELDQALCGLGITPGKPPTIPKEIAASFLMPIVSFSPRSKPHLLTNREEDERKEYYMPASSPDMNLLCHTVRGQVCGDGLLAFRCWEFDRGYLRSTAQDTTWREVMYADKLPSASNKSGLYATKLDPYTLLRKTWEIADPLCGLVVLKGKIEEHRDGILRAEYARIVNIFFIPSWVSKETRLGQVIRELHWNYPNVPLLVLLPEQLATLLTILTSKGLEAKS